MWCQVHDNSPVANTGQQQRLSVLPCSATILSEAPIIFLHQSSLFRSRVCSGTPCCRCCWTRTCPPAAPAPASAARPGTSLHLLSSSAPNTKVGCILSIYEHLSIDTWSDQNTVNFSLFYFAKRQTCLTLSVCCRSSMSARVIKLSCGCIPALLQSVLSPVY